MKDRETFLRNARIYGAIGNRVMRANHPKRTTNMWARRGGRKPNPTLAEIRAAQSVATGSEPVSKRGGGPSTE